MCNWGLRQTAELENQMTSVERVVEYANLPSERSLDTDPDVLKKIQQPWPNRGIIKFKNVSLRYAADADNILRGLNFEISEKV